MNLVLSFCTLTAADGSRITVRSKSVEKTSSVFGPVFAALSSWQYAMTGRVPNRFEGSVIPDDVTVETDPL